MSSYYRVYKCKAENPYGLAFHDIELEEAHEPTELQQAMLGQIFIICIIEDVRLFVGIKNERTKKISFFG